MKYLFIFLSALIALASCKKSSSSGELSRPFSTSVIGKWNYTQTYYSDGGPLIYNSTNGLNQWINFETDGSFSSTVNAFKDFSKYIIQDSTHVKFTSLSQQDRLYLYHIESPENKLTLSPADFFCIEGCGEIFKK